MRISSPLLLAAALAACSSEPAPSPAQSNAAKDPLDDGKSEIHERVVACALAGKQTFDATCQIEYDGHDGRNYVTVRHPDGGFRRLEVLPDGKGYAAADGADTAATVRNGGETEVTVGEDHYLFPGPARADAPKQ